MTQESRMRLVIDAIHDAAIELAKYADAARHHPPELAPKPTPEEIKAFTPSPIAPETDVDELWSAAAISPDGKRYWGLGRTEADAKAFAWASSNKPDGIASVPFKVPTKVPDGWTFELYPPPEPRGMLAIGSPAIFEVVRTTIPDVTLDEIQEAIMRSLPCIGGTRH
jgi:hypothetical protein